MRHSSGTGTNGLVYLLSDHLGSTSLTVDPLAAANDNKPNVLTQLRYKPWGETRYFTGEAGTDFRFTGQRREASLGGTDGLYFYGARWYDPALGRFLSPDTIIPGTEDPLAWDRYSYVFNNPIKYNDPSGHCPWCLVGALVGAAVGYGVQVSNNYQNGYTGTDAWTQNISAETIVGGALVGAGAVIFAPAVVAVAGDTLVGAGLVTGSSALFGAGISAYSTSTALQGVIFGQAATVTSPPVSPSLNSTPSTNSVVNYGPETRSPNPVRPGAVTDVWDDFLGDKPHSSVGPNGVSYQDRIFSSDGTKSIRYGAHEMKLSHYHEKTWSYNSSTDTIDVSNIWRHIQDRKLLGEKL